MNKLYDVIIVGGGPAGIAAGIYAGRAQLNVVVLDCAGGGGQLNTIDTIENYPGFSMPLKGNELGQAMQKQMESFGPTITFDEAEEVKADSGQVEVRGSYGKYTGKTLIVATGASYRKLGVPGEENLQGRGVSYCATCDGPFFHKEHVVIVGGGDTAVKQAIYLSRIAAQVTLVHRRGQLRAEKIAQDKALNIKNIDFVWNSALIEILGENSVTSVKLKNLQTGKTSEFPTSGVFIFIGVRPNTDFIRNVVELDSAGFIKTDVCMRTSLPHIFAAGDVRTNSARQIASAIGDGVTALLNIQQMLDTTTPARDYT